MQLYEQIVWEEALQLPIYIGQKVAEISWKTESGSTVLEVPLFSSSDIHANNWNYALITGIGLLILALIWWIFLRYFR